MEKLCLIFSIIILLFSSFLIFKQTKKLKAERNKTVKEIWEEEKANFEKERKELIESYNREKTRLSDEQDKLKDQKTKLEKEISEKRNFNDSLLKIREEELDRLIEQKKKEKEQALNYKLLEEERKRTESLNNHFNEFVALQEKEKIKSIEELNLIKEELEDFRTQREAVNLAILREKELQEKESFYMIDVPQSDREDITVLRGIAPQLKNRESLNKLIYEVFVRRPLGEMIKRITGGRAISGIYKITYRKTGEAYVGKTTDIQTRWQNHIKTACGLEGAARSTFHNRLEKDGIWNYTFEVLEEVPKEKLSEREKFYIELYGTDTQLNMKKGG